MKDAVLDSKKFPNASRRYPPADGLGFVAFEAGSLTVELPVEAGAYALAVRFVRAETGQETAVVPIGKVAVGP